MQNMDCYLLFLLIPVVTDARSVSFLSVQNTVIILSRIKEDNLLILAFACCFPSIWQPSLFACVIFFLLSYANERQK